MDTVLLGALLLTVAALVAVVVAALRRPPASADLATPLQHLALAVQQGQAQTAVLAEKLGHLEPVAQAVGGIQVELRGLSERVARVEQHQDQVSQGMVALGTGLTETGAVAKSLVDATSAIRTELSRAKSDLVELQAHARARQELEQRTADSIRRLEAVIAGTQTKGSAGENLLEAVFAKLPQDWQVRNFRVGNRAVEFGLRLPNNLVLPIDSKWAATPLLEQFLACEDPSEQQRLKAQIAAAVVEKAKEVRKYLDPRDGSPAPSPCCTTPATT
ncbi:MAG: DNA recombination protein RmuC [Chloroflexi bacterium]|nr:DNA recombination protein RmuC [Chloroflexota bacterium]